MVIFHHKKLSYKCTARRDKRCSHCGHCGCVRLGGDVEGVEKIWKIKKTWSRLLYNFLSLENKGVPLYPSPTDSITRTREVVRLIPTMFRSVLLLLAGWSTLSGSSKLQPTSRVGPLQDIIHKHCSVTSRIIYWGGGGRSGHREHKLCLYLNFLYILYYLATVSFTALKNYMDNQGRPTWKNRYFFSFMHTFRLIRSQTKIVFCLCPDKVKIGIKVDIRRCLTYNFFDAELCILKIYGGWYSTSFYTLCGR